MPRSSTIRPVTRKLPDSKELWDDTNLPMCVVVSPACHTTAKPLLGPSSSRNTNSSKYNNNNIKALNDIPKCLYCGAPHITRETHFRPIHEQVLVCYLCGNTSSTHIQDQQDGRPGERLWADTYDVDTAAPPPLATGEWILNLPLQPPSSSSSSLNVVDNEEIPKLPALACPPVWWIVLDASVPVGHSYWKTMSEVLGGSSSSSWSSLWGDIPSHVHVGVLAVSSTTCTVYDLTTSYSNNNNNNTHTSNGNDTDDTDDNDDDDDDDMDPSSPSYHPHVLHYPLTTRKIPLSLVPADSTHKPTIQTVVRALPTIGAGTVPPIHRPVPQEDDDDGDEDTDSISEWSPPGMVLSVALEIILDFMQPAWHPGQADPQEAPKNLLHKNNNTTKGKTSSSLPLPTLLPTDKDPYRNSAYDDGTSLKYAGGKITCFLARPPMEIVPKKDAPPCPPPCGPIGGGGGVAGSCRNTNDDDGYDLWDNLDQRPDHEPTDWTPTNLAQYVEPLDPEDMMQALGTKCSRAALGVDLFILVPSEGGPPLPNGKDNDNDKGGTKTKTKKKKETAEQLQQPFYGLPLLTVLTNASGAPGPLMFATGKNDASNLSRVKAIRDQLMARVPWQEGVIFGTQLRSRITKGFTLEDSPVEKVGRSKLQLAPYLSSGGLSGPGVSEGKGIWTLGSCDVHTSVVLDYQIVGRPDMVVTTDGMGRMALKPVLQICVAYTCVEKDRDDGEYYTVRKMKISSLSLPLTSDSEVLYDAMDPEALAVILCQKLALTAVQEGFVAAQETAETWLKALLVRVYQSAQVEQAKIEERLELNAGHSSPTTVHEEKESGIVACERLLDIEGGELSDEDVILGQGHAKVAVMPLIVYALMQCEALRPTMGRFTPSMDARCAALTQMLSMNPSSLSKCIAPSLQLWSTEQDKILKDCLDLSQEALDEALKECNAPDAVFFLDSPQQILVYRADQGNVPYRERSARANLTLGPRLKAAIQAATKAYRTRPVFRSHLKAIPFSKASAMAFDNVLLEDCPTFGGAEDYNSWKKQIANEVHDELKKSGDIIS